MGCRRKDRRGEGAKLGSLGLAYAGLGQVEKALSLLEQARRIGEEINDPRIVAAATQAIKKLRGES